LHPDGKKVDAESICLYLLRVKNLRGHGLKLFSLFTNKGKTIYCPLIQIKGYKNLLKSSTIIDEPFLIM